MAKLIPEELRRLRITREMQKIVLKERQTIVRKIISEMDSQRDCSVVAMSKAGIFW